MKNLKYLLICLLLFPVIVKADMGAPEVRPYELVVIDPDGVDYYPDETATSPSGHIDKDEVVEVTYEYDGAYHITLKNNDYGVLKSSEGTALVKDEVDPTKEQDDYIFKLDKEKVAIVYAKEGIDLYKGPSSIYDKVTHVKKGTKLKYYYKTSDTHIYTEYNGKKGWAEVLNEKILLPERADYIAKSDIKLSCGTISKNKVVQIKYKTDIWSHKGLVEFNNCEELVDIFRSSELLNVYKQNATSKKDLKIYEYAGNSGKELGIIPSGSEFLSIAAYYIMGEEIGDIYVEYNDIRGWIKANFNDYEVDENELENKEILDISSDSDDEEIEEKEEIKENKTEIKKDKKQAKSDDYVLICVIVGVSVALSSLVTIIIMNKKNNQKTITDEIKKEDN